jgi:hypothetical protein
MDTYASLDTQIAAIEAQIAHLRAQARLLRLRRNALTPFARIPTEIIHYILDVLVLSILLPEHLGFTWYRNDTETWYPPGDRIGWANVTGVCTFLRDVAVRYPTLWSHIDLSRNSNWVSISLERARGHPLLLTYGGSPDSSKDQLLLDVIDRACDARIYTTSSSGVRFMSSVLDRVHSRLRSLTYAPKYGDTLNLRGRFLSAGSSSITRLVLVNAEVLFDGVSLPALEYLDCSRIRAVEQPQRIFDLIRGAQWLSHLRMSGIEPTFDFTQLRVPRIGLPRLDEAEITADFDWLAAFIITLPVPPRSYILSVHKDTPNLSSPRSMAMRQYVVDLVFRLMAIDKDAYWPPDVRLSLDEKSGRWRLEIVRSNGDPELHYMDYCDGFEGFHYILGRAQSLHVDGLAAQIFEHALEYDMPDPLAAVDELVLIYVTGYLTEFDRWLARRAESRPPLQSLELRGCRGLLDSRTALKHYLKSLRRRRLVISTSNEDYDSGDDASGDEDSENGEEETDEETDEETSLETDELNI